MKRALTKNWGLKLLAFVFSVLLWIIVMNIEDPVDERTFSGIQVTVTHPEIVTNPGNTYQILDDSRTVSVTVKAKRSILNKIKTDDIRATADMKNLDVRTRSLIPIDISIPSYAGRFEATANPINLRVSIELGKSETFPITATSSGTPRDGYQVGELKANPEKIKISGPESVIDSIDKVVALVDVSGQSKDEEKEAELILYDNNGKIIDSTQIENNLGDEGLKVKITMLQTKSIPVEFDTSLIGTASGYHFSGISIQPESIQIVGTEEQLETVDSIEIPAEELAEEGYDAVSLEGGYIAWLLDTVKQQEAEDYCKEVEKSIRKKFRKTIWCRFVKAVKDYELVKPGDRIAVCISGGKDSMLMAKLFQELLLHHKFDFTVKFLVMDPGYSPANRQVIEENARRLQIPIKIYESDIFDSVYTIEKSPCYLCARMRRGHLYSFAKEMGCNKIALGHHFDDVIETILMGMLYGGQVQTMMPKLHSTNFEGMELIRPLYLIREDDIKAWRDYNDLHFIQCACKFTDTCTTCNNNENRSKRVEIKELIKTLKQVNPFVESNIFRSVENVNLSTVVAYKKDGVKHHFLDTYDDVVQTENEPGMQSGAEIQMQSEETR